MDQPETGSIQPTIFSDIKSILERCEGYEEKQTQLSLEELDLAKKRTTSTPAYRKRLNNALAVAEL